MATNLGCAYSSPGLDQRQRWRALDIEQQVLDNARELWRRNVAQNRRDADERAAQLRHLARLSALVTGFAMASFLQFNFDVDSVQSGVLVAYAAVTALVASLNMCSLTMSNLVLASILRVADNCVSAEEESHYILECRNFALRYRKGLRPPAPRRTFRNLWDARCAGIWRRAFYMFSLGVPLFMVMMGLSAWIKFVGFRPAAIAMLAILGLGLAYFLLTHAKWVRHVGRSDQASQLKGTQPQVSVPPMGLPYDWHLIPQMRTGIVEPAESEPPPSPLIPSPDKKTHAWEDVSLSQTWRAEDLELRLLGNARVLWKRYVEMIVNDTGDRAEELRSLAFLSGIMGAFTMDALLQLDFQAAAFKPVITCGYGLTLGIAVGLITCSMVMCGFINISILRIGAALTSAKEEAVFLAQCRIFATRFKLGDHPPGPKRNFRNFWHTRCESAWSKAFYMFTTGALIFQVNLIFAAWIKFNEGHKESAITMTILLGFGLLYMIGVNIRWARNVLFSSTSAMDEAAQWATDPTPVGLPFDWHLPARPMAPRRHVHADGHSPAPSKLHATAAVTLPPHSPYADMHACMLRGSEVLQGGRAPDLEDHGMHFWSEAKQWRAEDMAQRNVNNARALWCRAVKRNLADLEERQEQLSTVAELAALITGFEMIAFLQFNFDTNETGNVLQLAYAVTSALTVALQACAMTNCGLILESILQAASDFVSDAEEAIFMTRCFQFASRYKKGDRPPRLRRTFRNHWELRCEPDWRFAFYMFSVGVPVFLANAALSGWIKWQEFRLPAILITLFLGMGVVFLAQNSMRFIRHLVTDSTSDPEEDDTLPASLDWPFDWHMPPRHTASTKHQSMLLRAAQSFRRISFHPAASEPPSDDSMDDAYTKTDHRPSFVRIHNPMWRAEDSRSEKSAAEASAEDAASLSDELGLTSKLLLEIPQAAHHGSWQEQPNISSAVIGEDFRQNTDQAVRATSDSCGHLGHVDVSINIPVSPCEHDHESSCCPSAMQCAASPSKKGRAVSFDEQTSRPTPL